MSNIVDKRLELLGKQLAAWTKLCTPLASQVPVLREQHTGTLIKAYVSRIGGCSGGGAVIALLLLREVCDGIEKGLNKAGLEIPPRRSDVL